MPCPHHDIKIVQRSNRQSAVAAAAYQSGERLFSEYDQKQKYYAEKRGIVHTEIMLPPHAPPEYADRNTLWNAAEAIENVQQGYFQEGSFLLSAESAERPVYRLPCPLRVSERPGGQKPSAD